MVAASAPAVLTCPVVCRFPSTVSCSPIRALMNRFMSIVQHIAALLQTHSRLVPSVNLVSMSASGTVACTHQHFLPIAAWTHDMAAWQS